jgi:NAD-dependent DNA ligase
MKILFRGFLIVFKHRLEKKINIEQKNYFIEKKIQNLKLQISYSNRNFMNLIIDP